MFCCKRLCLIQIEVDNNTPSGGMSWTPKTLSLTTSPHSLLHSPWVPPHNTRTKPGEGYCPRSRRIAVLRASFPPLERGFYYGVRENPTAHLKKKSKYIDLVQFCRSCCSMNGILMQPTHSKRWVSPLLTWNCSYDSNRRQCNNKTGHLSKPRP